jgi:hypothetical protein
MLAPLAVGFFFRTSLCAWCTERLNLHWSNEEIVGYANESYAESTNYTGSSRLGISGSYVAFDTGLFRPRCASATYRLSSASTAYSQLWFDETTNAVEEKGEWEWVLPLFLYNQYRYN